MAESSVDTAHCGLFVEPARWFGVDGGLCLNELTPITILVSAGIALVIGIGGWWCMWWINRRLAKKEAALLLLSSREPEYREDFFSLWIMIRKDTNFETLVEHEPVGRPDKDWAFDRHMWNLPIEQKQWLTVSRCLNFYEIIAIAIEEHAVDEKIMGEFLRPRLKDHIEMLYPFIKAIRNKASGDPTTWTKVERLARKWGADIDC